MELTNLTILDLLNEIDRRSVDTDSGLLNSQSNKKVLEHLNTHPNDSVGLSLTFGKPTILTEKTNLCSRCGKIKDSSHFRYYQARVDADGFLLRINSICDECETSSNNQRKNILLTEFENGNIPQKPENGDVCPHCGKPWYGKWHRHHDITTGKFVKWICGHCNMAMNDQRNATPNNELVTSSPNNEKKGWMGLFRNW